jgi:hypothetical protein
VKRVGIYRENCMTNINALCQTMLSFLKLEQVARISTTLDLKYLSIVRGPILSLPHTLSWRGYCLSTDWYLSH